MPDLGRGCGQNAVNPVNDDFGHGWFDSFSSAIAHELAEAITDPFPDLPANAPPTGGWFDSSGPQAGETADKCSGSVPRNMAVDGHLSGPGRYYAVPPLWSNRDAACVFGGISRPVAIPSFHPFSPQAITSTSAALRVDIRRGNLEAMLGAVTVGGPNSGDFRVLTDGCSGVRLLPARTCPLEIVFHPTAAGFRAAVVDVANDSGSATGITLIGRGTAPGVAVEPARLDFGGQRAGTTGAALTVVLPSSGTTPLEIGAVGIAGVAAADYAKTADNCADRSLPTGATCSVSVTFTPRSRGLKNARLDFSVNTAVRILRVDLAGLGIAPNLVVEAVKLDFGKVGPGAPPPYRTLLLRNTGDASLQLFKLGFRGPGTARFSVVPLRQVAKAAAVTTAAGVPLDCLQTAKLAPQQACQLGIVLEPVAFGPVEAELTIATDAGVDPILVALSGFGSGPEASLRPATIKFADTELGEDSEEVAAVLTNTGDGILHRRAARLTGADAGDFEIDGTPVPSGNWRPAPVARSGSSSSLASQEPGRRSCGSTATAGGWARCGCWASRLVPAGRMTTGIEANC